MAIAQAHGGQTCSLLLERRFVFAQPRDVLTAEDSSIVTQEDEDGRTSFPKRAKPKIASVGVWQDNVRSASLSERRFTLRRQSSLSDELL